MGAMLNHALLRHCLAQGSASPALAKNTETNIAPAAISTYWIYLLSVGLLLIGYPTLVAERLIRSVCHRATSSYSLVGYAVPRCLSASVLVGRNFL